METFISVQQVEDAIRLGVNEGIINGKTVKLPSPQKTGTFTQQQTYANMKAQQLFESAFKPEPKKAERLSYTDYGNGVVALYQGSSYLGDFPTDENEEKVFYNNNVYFLDLLDER